MWDASTAHCKHESRELWPSLLRRYPPAQRYTLLLAFLSVRGEELTDDIVEMFDTLVGRVFSDTEEELVAAKAAQAQAFAEGARLFRTVGTILLDPAVPPRGCARRSFGGSRPSGSAP